MINAKDETNGSIATIADKFRTMKAEWDNEVDHDDFSHIISPKVGEKYKVGKDVITIGSVNEGKGVYAFWRGPDGDVITDYIYYFSAMISEGKAIKL
jgi:hypothetical protein